ncbi:hypothetical protein [Bacterioplanoides sp.]|uniref:hypothetical protein n=1 Tax=Bacterioplanoides sp. TaxID=2066072 RepID=UPI003B001B6A
MNCLRLNQSLWHRLALALLLTVTFPALSQVPQTLQLSGDAVLADSVTPLTGAQQVRFTLYATDGADTIYANNGGTYVDPLGAGASVVWTDVQTVEFTEGKYSVVLGNREDNPFPVDAFINDQRAIGIQIGSDDELSPRLTLNTVPFAFRSAVSENAEGNITPLSVSIKDQNGNLTPVINEQGEWIGSSSGLAGIQGPPGVAGEKGDKGDTGAQGPQGVAGEKGDKGDTGAQGPQGVAGAKGDKGDTGAQGPQGVAGAKGDKGDTGARGTQGVSGTPGPPGTPGAPGPPGAPGSDGTISSSSLSSKVCNAVFSCSCDDGEFILSAGASCAKNQYLYQSQPDTSDFKLWHARCEVFSNGVDVAPTEIRLTCVTE